MYQIGFIRETTFIFLPRVLFMYIPDVRYYFSHFSPDSTVFPSVLPLHPFATVLLLTSAVRTVCCLLFLHASKRFQCVFNSCVILHLRFCFSPCISFYFIWINLSIILSSRHSFIHTVRSVLSLCFLATKHLICL